MRCFRCGNEIPNDLHYCVVCGTILYANEQFDDPGNATICAVCGEPLLEDDIFCTICGTQRQSYVTITGETQDFTDSGRTLSFADTAIFQPMSHHPDATIVFTPPISTRQESAYDTLTGYAGQNIPHREVNADALREQKQNIKKRIKKEKPIKEISYQPENDTGSAVAVKTKLKRPTLIIGIVLLAVIALVGASFAVYAFIRNGQYNSAVQQYNEGQYLAAYEGFNALGNYKDSVSLAGECRKFIDYDHAMSSFNKADYEEAADAFFRLGDFQDARSYYEKSLSFIEYYNAMDLMQTGKFEAAYFAFLELGEFEDSAQKANECIREKPANGLVEKGSGYSESNDGTQLTLVNANSRDYYILIFLENETYWGSVWVGSGMSATVALPVGSYYALVHWGANWFGSSDIFGDDDDHVSSVNVDGGHVFRIYKGRQTLTLN